MLQYHFHQAVSHFSFFTYAESKKENPRAVVGLIDITVRPMVEADMLSFSVPYKMFVDMEESVGGSFLEKHLWHRVMVKMESYEK